MNLKIGGNNVGKIMYNGQEFGGAAKLEPGTILYMSETAESYFESVHLLSTTKNWNNLNGINVRAYSSDFSKKFVDVDIPSDDFKNVDIRKSYNTGTSNDSMNISTSIVDGEYRLNTLSFYSTKLIIKAI
ncbi:hypothetical protein COSHB9_02140 [Companilactobacillus alimentarius]